MRPVVTLDGRIVQVARRRARRDRRLQRDLDARRPTPARDRLGRLCRRLPARRERAATRSPAREAIVAGQRCPLAGRVSMDLIAVDVTDLADERRKRGDLVEPARRRASASTTGRARRHHRLRGADQPRAALPPRLSLMEPRLAVWLAPGLAISGWIFWEWLVLGFRHTAAEGRGDPDVPDDRHSGDDVRDCLQRRTLGTARADRSSMNARPLSLHLPELRRRLWPLAGQVRRLRRVEHDRRGRRRRRPAGPGRSARKGRVFALEPLAGETA